jgi:hypothetical protein
MENIIKLTSLFAALTKVAYLPCFIVLFAYSSVAFIFWASNLTFSCIFAPQNWHFFDAPPIAVLQLGHSLRLEPGAILPERWIRKCLKK